MRQREMLMAGIHVKDVCVTYQVCKGGRSTLKEWVLGGLRQRQEKWVQVRALQDVSFDVAEGSRLGIVGHNGAGKSTLLKVLSGIYQPLSGICKVDGRIASLFDLSLGFEPDASGWDNIHYRGYLQKETPQSLRGKVREIAEFSGLGSALDLPIRYYSSGMLVRLAFSIATAIEPEVFLVDEVLGAGDLEFAQRAKMRIHHLVRKARLMVVVSHDLNALASFCDRVLWLDHGQVRELGPAKSTIHAYTQFMQHAAA